MPNKIADRLLSAVNISFESVASGVQAVAARISDYTGTKDEDPVPKEWDDRAKLCWLYYMQVDAVKKPVHCWCTFVLGDGIKYLTKKEEEREKIEEYEQKVGMYESLWQVLVLLIVKGEVGVFKHREDDGTIRLRAINPLSLKITYEAGKLVKLEQYTTEDRKVVAQDGTWEGETLDAWRYLRLEYQEEDGVNKRADGLTTAALDKIPILLNLRKAENSIAKRFVNVIRLVKLGGAVGNKVFIPKAADLQKMQTTLNTMDQRQALVTDPFVEIVQKGVEGDILNTTERIVLQTNQIAMAHDLEPIFITGEGPNFSTARIVFKAKTFQIKRLAQKIKSLMIWFFNDPEVRKAIGIAEDVKIGYFFTGLRVDDEEWEVREDREAVDRALISRRTYLERRGVDPDQEEARLAAEMLRIRNYMTPGEMAALVQAQVFTPKVAAAVLGISEEELESVAAALTKKSEEKNFNSVAHKMLALQSKMEADKKTATKKKPPKKVK